MDSPPDHANNSLGLDLDALKIHDDSDHPASSEQAAEENTPAHTEDAETSNSVEETQETPAEEGARSPTSESKRPEGKEKKKPYVNPDRVNTGGAQRDKLSEDELKDRMVRIREQNEKIKLRRIDVQADEEAFRKTQEAERIKAAKTKKVQETIDRTREQNARRKMEKMQSREWDSGKSSREWKQAGRPEEENRAPRASVGIRGAVRGGGSGRGRGRVPSTATSASSDKVAEEAATPPAASAAAAS